MQNSDFLSTRYCTGKFEIFMISTRARLSATNLLIRWKRDKKCPDCGIVAKAGVTGLMRDTCGNMWRKYHGLDDRHCCLWAHAEVASIKAADQSLSKPQWENMPHILGRS